MKKCKRCGNPVHQDARAYWCDWCKQLWPNGFEQYIDDRRAMGTEAFDNEYSGTFEPVTLTEPERLIVARLLNKHIVGVQQSRELRGESIELDAMRRDQPVLLSLVDKVLYGESNGSIRSGDRHANRVSDSVCGQCKTNPCHCEIAELN